jgi:hypothetical protein
LEVNIIDLEVLLRGTFYGIPLLFIVVPLSFITIITLLIFLIRFIKKTFYCDCNGCPNYETEYNESYHEEECYICKRITCFRTETGWSDTITCLCCNSSTTREKDIP